MAKISDLYPLILSEWLARDINERTMLDVLSFYTWLQKNRPDLLAFRCNGHKSQKLKELLADHIIA